jgi:hypothetical protein
MMGFLNAALLLGSLAFLVPLVIHLLNRSRFQTVDWGAMHLLESVALQNAKKIQWQALLLLLVRCAIPILLALAMARPILDRFQLSSSGSPSATAFLIDDSYSMQAPAAGSTDPAVPETLWQFAERSVKQVAEGLGRSDHRHLLPLRSSAEPQTLASHTDPRPIVGQVQRMAPDQGPIDPVAAMQQSLDRLEKSSQPVRRVVIWSDFHRQDWQATGSESMAAIRKRAESMVVPPEFHWIPLATSTPVANLQVMFDTASTEVSLLGEPLELRVTVANQSAQPATEVPVRLQLDGMEIATKRIDVAARSSAQLAFAIAIDREGAHTVGVSVEDPSTIDQDDLDELSIEVLPTRRILLVDPNPQQRLLDSETGFLKLALEATLGDQADRQSPAVNLVRTSPDRLTQELIRVADVLVLANIARLPDNLVEAIRGRVEEGARLCVFGGPQIDIGWYHQFLGVGSPAPLLPMKYGNWKTLSKDSANPQEQLLTIAPAPYSDPSLTFFNQPQQGRLDQSTIRALRPLLPWNDPSSATPDSPAGDPPTANSTPSNSPGSVLLKLADGQPLLAVQSWGKGVVLQWAIGANEASSDLPVRPAFVPLIQRLLLWDAALATPRPAAQARRESEIDPMSPDEISQLASQLGATVHVDAESFLQSHSQKHATKEIWRWLLALLVLALFGELLIEKRLTGGGR